MSNQHNEELDRHGGQLREGPVNAGEAWADLLDGLNGTSVESDYGLGASCVHRARPTVEKVAIVQFDPEGDVILNLSCSEGCARFQINSSILCSQSGVFRAILGRNSPFKKTRDIATGDGIAPPLEVPLADDDPRALAVILRIVHLQHDWVPKSLNEDRLYQIAILCDKYELTQGLGFYLQKWLYPHLSQTDVPARTDRWLFMAYAFALPEVFTRCSKELMLNISVGGSGDPFGPRLDTSSGIVPVDTHIPPTIVSKILDGRRQAIESLMDCAYRYIDRYSDSSRTFCKHQEVNCDLAALGALTRAFKSIEIYPVRSNPMDRSLSEVKKLMKGALKDNLDDPYFGGALLGCCESPTLSIYAFHFAFRPNCTNCHRSFRSASGRSHALCSPLARIEAKMDQIVNEVTGLQYSSFARRNTESSTAETTPAPVEDLWESLVFQ